MIFSLFSKPETLPSAGEALPGRDQPLDVAETHFVSGRPLKGPYPNGAETIYFGLGCFWGAERLFWQLPGVWVTASGYQGGLTPNPAMRRSVRAAPGMLKRLWSFTIRSRFARNAAQNLLGKHTTQGMRQGNDVGTQYRSAIYTTNAAQSTAVTASRERYQARLMKPGPARSRPKRAAGPFYFAETYHQQYLAKNPNGYCG